MTNREMKKIIKFITGGRVKMYADLIQAAREMDTRFLAIILTAVDVWAKAHGKIPGDVMRHMTDCVDIYGAMTEEEVKACVDSVWGEHFN